MQPTSEGIAYMELLAAEPCFAPTDNWGLDKIGNQELFELMCKTPK